MNSKIADYVQEFDDSVKGYNHWLESLENPKAQRRNKVHVLLTGMGSALDLFGNSSNNSNIHPLYSRDDLTSQQKDAIALASDWQRVDRSLDKLLSNNSSDGQISVEDAKAGKAMALRMYGHFRNIYVSDAIKEKIK